MSVEFPENPVRVQLKCSSAKQMTSEFETIDFEDYWIEQWKLNIGPVFIVLVVVPGEIAKWVTEGDRETLHQTHAYWARFDPTSDRKSVRVYRSNRVTLGTLIIWRNAMRAIYGMGAVGDES